MLVWIWCKIFVWFRIKIVHFSLENHTLIFLVMSSCLTLEDNWQYLMFVVWCLKISCLCLCILIEQRFHYLKIACLKNHQSVQILFYLRLDYNVELITFFCSISMFFQFLDRRTDSNLVFSWTYITIARRKLTKQFNKD